MKAIPPIDIIYFAYIHTRGKSWKESYAKTLITQQLQDLKDIELDKAAQSIHIVLTIPPEINKDEVVNDIKSILPSAIFHINHKNQYEYPGIHLAWKIGKNTPETKAHETLVLYFHSKGIFSNENTTIRAKDHVKLTDSVIKPWKKIVKRFQDDPGMNKAGFGIAPNGSVWYNFWWARASYLAQCVKPLLTERRHYYEEWLGKKNLGKNDVNHPETPRRETTNGLSLGKNKGANGNLGNVYKDINIIGKMMEGGSTRKNSRRMKHKTRRAHRNK